MKSANLKPLPASGFVATLLAALLGVIAVVGCLTLNARLSAAQSGAPSNAHPGPGGSQTAPFSHSLPQMDGNHLRVTLAEVNYAAGESDKPHSHPCPVIGYVARGAIRFQVKGGPETVYKAGEGFYEPPNGVHQVSANASDKEPATLIAYFTCDHDTPLTVPPLDGDAGHKAK